MEQGPNEDADNPLVSAKTGSRLTIIPKGRGKLLPRGIFTEQHPGSLNSTVDRLRSHLTSGLSAIASTSQGAGTTGAAGGPALTPQKRTRETASMSSPSPNNQINTSQEKQINKRHQTEGASSVFPYNYTSKSPTFNKILPEIADKIANKHNATPKTNLEWHRETDLSSVNKYQQFSMGPFVVLVESTLPGKNIGKMDPFAVSDIIAPIVPIESRKIYRSGSNQLKIFCTEYTDANRLVESSELKRQGIFIYIPDSFIRKKGFTNAFPPDRTIERIVEGLDPDDRNSIRSIRRCFNEDHSLSSRVEFIFDSIVIPRNIEIEGFSIPITPVVPKPSRCFRCQRHCHVLAQCRSSRPYCEYCSEAHQTTYCPNLNRERLCKNCKGKHVASSADCPIYIREFEISKLRYVANLNREDAISFLIRKSPDLFQHQSGEQGSPNRNQPGNSINKAANNNDRENRVQPLTLPEITPGSDSNPKNFSEHDSTQTNNNNNPFPGLTTDNNGKDPKNSEPSDSLANSIESLSSLPSELSHLAVGVSTPYLQRTLLSQSQIDAFGLMTDPPSEQIDAPPAGFAAQSRNDPVTETFAGLNLSLHKLMDQTNPDDKGKSHNVD
ncbi:uncharacterized protein LOC122499372 [Leptopilina heterotoma]|uniref:uncharacterized protein LOC122499372 n=1 Tax=Leptopilina heterotoma TaxID=63436 RepID=UPI001CA94C65|nr:uncharacterized protein LOC122499372 [Leptopilina heterotoma]XP_043463623.1 uncharacterized protein LOC122499372 [Leptopilina heterotoma]